jgi:sorting nexin-8
VALALVALAQQGKGRPSFSALQLCTERKPLTDVSIEQVAALSSQNTLPEPSLDLDRLQTSTSTFVQPTHPPPMRGYSVDPWSASRQSAMPPPSTYSQGIGSAPSGTASSGVGSTIVAGSGLPDYWWQKQEKVKVSLLGHQGFILNRYVVYEIVTEARPFRSLSCMTG